MDESLAVNFLMVGLALALLGWLILVVQGFRLQRRWGLACLVPPLCLLFVLFHFRKTWKAAAVVLLGFLIASTPVAAHHFLPADLGPREKHFDGKMEITLTDWDTSEPAGVPGVGVRLSRWLNRSATGWDRRDYSVLRTKTDVTYLQMANPDVTDATLDYLRGLKKLERLDLSNSQVTNAGLALLRELPRLERLWLSHTDITDEGVRQHLLPHPTLKMLEMRDTDLTPVLRDDWRKAGRRILWSPKERTP